MGVITLKLKLFKPTKEKQIMYEKMSKLNTDFANWLIKVENINKASSKIFKEFSGIKFPSAVACETVRIVKAKLNNQNTKNFKNCWCGYNNQNFKVEKENSFYKTSFPTLEKRIGVPVIVKEKQKYWLEKLLKGEVKQGTATLIERGGRWYVYISLSFNINERENVSKVIMGVDLGIREIAVASIGTKSKFFNGKEVAFKRRRFKSIRRKIGIAKKYIAIKNMKDKESRWVRDVNHKISRSIIKFALENGVHLIRLENLKGIKLSLKSVKDPGKSIHNWSHSQLQKFICYKAELVGIKIEFVNPSKTSQTCKCGYTNKKNRIGSCFKCNKCGYKAHSDLNAAINISKAISGLSYN